MKTKILIVEHDSNDMELIQQELKKGKVNFIAEIVYTKKEYEKAIHNFKPDIILSNYTFPSFDGATAFKIKEKLAPQTPFIFVSESIGEENAIELIRNGVTDFVLKERLSTLATKVNRALNEAALSKLIAEQKHSEEKRMEELCRNESKYSSLVESSMDAILLTVKDGRILAANTAACEIFQMTQDEICNSGRYDIVDSTDMRLQPLLEERNRTGKAKGEITFKRKDGSRFPGEITSVVFTDTSGLEKTSMTIRDTTEWKQVEDKQIKTSEVLQLTLNNLNKILNSSLDVICSFDEEGRFVSANAVSESIWGYTPQELIGKKYMDFVFHEDAEKTINADGIIKSGKDITMFENRYIHKNGSIVPMVWSAIWDDEYKVSYCTARDATEKKKLEKAFEIERQRFMDLYLQAPSCMGTLKGPNHIYEMANPLYLQLIEKEDIIGKMVKEVLPELEAQGIFEFLDTVYNTGETFSANEMLVKFDFHGNGNLVDTYLNFIYQAHRGLDGEIDGILFFAINVTEQVLSRKKIEESEKRFRALIEKSEEMIMLTSVEGKLLYGSPSISKVFGYSEEDVADKFTYQYIHPEDLTGFLKKRAKLLATPGKSFYHQQRVRHKNGNWIWCENTVTNMLNEPSINALVTNFRDITEKKIAEQALRESEIKYRYLFENNPMPMWVIDLNTFKFLDVNEMAILHYGYSREEFLSMTAIDIRPDEDKELFRHSSVTSEIIGTNYNRGTWKHRKKDGTIIPVEIIAHEIIFEGSLARFILSNDITDRKKAELKLEQQNIELVKTNSELDRFVYSVSHDLRSPLTSILGLLSFIEDESKEEDTLEHAMLIRNSINRLDEFIKNILSYSRNNRTTLEVKKISLQKTVKEIVNSLHGMREAKGIHFEIDIKEPQSFYSDRIRFNTILENLISNAIKYHQKEKSGRYIKITGHSDHEKLQLSIADNGIGIESANHNKIFDMFFRLSGKKDGSGIGLYIVKNTVEKLKGSIHVESELGTGTTFIIILKNLKS